MSRVEVVHHPTPAITEFVGRHFPDLSDLGLITLRSAVSAAAPAGYLAVTAHRSDTEPGGIDGYAQVSSVLDSQSLEVCAPDDLVADLVATALDAAPPGDDIRWWIHHTPHGHETIAHDLGFVLERVLHEMRRPLPAECRSSIVTRAFDPATDGEHWLAVNNRAFAGHPEQGGWSLGDLSRRRAEPWHDDSGLRVHEIDGRLGGFCWVKTDGTTGEIYVIGVDPDFHGRGLGRQLTLAGLDWMVDHGLAVARLFVDADNEPAMNLYEDLGFATVRTDRCYVVSR